MGHDDHGGVFQQWHQVLRHRQVLVQDHMGISKTRGSRKVGTAVDHGYMQALQPRHAHQRLRVMTAAKDHQAPSGPQRLNQHVQRRAVRQFKGMQTGPPSMPRLLQHRQQ